MGVQSRGQVAPKLRKGHKKRKLISTLTHFDCLCVPSSSTPGLLNLTHFGCKHPPRVSLASFALNWGRNYKGFGLGTQLGSLDPKSLSPDLHVDPNCHPFSVWLHSEPLSSAMEP